MPATTPRSERRTGRRTVALGLLVSAAFHVVVLLWPLEPRRPDGQRREGTRSAEGSPRALHVYRLLPADDPIEPGAPRPRTPLEPRAAPTDTHTEAPVAVDPMAASATVAPPSPTLDPHLTDSRLWPVATRALPLDSNALEGERAVLATRIRASDAAYEAGKHEVRGVATWATEGARPWGVSPGRVHLGAVTLRTCGGGDPAGCGFGLLPNRVGAYLSQAGVLAEIGLQGQRVELRRTWADRARAIRVRRDEARSGIELGDRARGDTISRR